MSTANVPFEGGFVALASAFSAVRLGLPSSFCRLFPCLHFPFRSKS
jgi:hypothetical protein